MFGKFYHTACSGKIDPEFQLKWIIAFIVEKFVSVNVPAAAMERQ